MTGWDACTQEPCALIRWLECHPGTAGWAQLFGTLAAIAFAYVLGRAQIRAARLAEDRKRDSKAKALALLLVAPVADVISEMERIKDLITHYEHGMGLITPAISTHESAVRAMTIQASPYDALLLRVDALPVDAANLVVRLFSFVADFNGYIADVLPATRRFDGNQREEFIAEVDGKVAGIERLIDPLKQALDKVTNSPAP